MSYVMGENNSSWYMNTDFTLLSSMNSSSTNSSLHIPSTMCDLSQTTYKGVALTIFLLCVVCANVIGNLLVIYVSISTAELKRRKNTYFIVSLAVSDIGYACTVIPFTVSVKLHGGTFCHHLAACYFAQIVDVLWTASTLLVLFAIAIDRFIAITKPFAYQDIVTSRVTKATVGGCWSFGLLWSLVGLFKWGKKDSMIQDGSVLSITLKQSGNIKVCMRSDNSYYFVASLIGLYMIPLIIMGVTYSMVLAVAFTQIKAIESTTVYLDADSSKKSQGNRRRQKEWKATKSVGIVYICYFICWFPLVIINLIYLFDTKTALNWSILTKNILTYTFTDILPPLNTVMNPLIYSFSNELFRESLRRMMCKKHANTASYMSNNFTDVRGAKSNAIALSVQPPETCDDNKRKHSEDDNKIPITEEDNSVSTRENINCAENKGFEH